jgi:hypothetical protein
MSYREAASLLDEFLPPRGGANHATTRNRVFAVGRRIEEEIQGEAAAVRVPANPAKQMVVGIDGAFVKECRPRRPGAPASLEIVTGCIETDAVGSKVFGIVRDRDGHARGQLQALLQRNGRGPGTKVRVLCDGEDGIRSIVSEWFDAREKHVLDWFHIVRQLDRIGRSLLYLPHLDDFSFRLRRHWANLNRARWRLWDGNLYGAGIALSCLYDGVDIHVMIAGSGRSTADQIRERLAKLWSYLCANESRLVNYGKERRQGHRVSTAHVESTVNRLVNWRMCKKQQMRWTARGAQMVLHARCALLNRDLARYTGSSKPARSCQLAPAA